jgi:hypothetical protein
MSQPHFGNSKLKLKNTLYAENHGTPKEYQVSAWLSFNNGWDDANNRPNPMTAEQQNLIAGIYEDLANMGVEIQMTLKDRNGQDPKQWPIAGRMKLFVNTNDGGSQGGGGGSAW